MSAKNIELKSAASIFTALGDQTRLELFARLCDQGPMSIARLTIGTEVTRQAITKHLVSLEAAGLLRGVRRGRERVWEPRPDQMRAARRWMKQISRQWEERLEHLKTSVEKPG